MQNINQKPIHTLLQSCPAAWPDAFLVFRRRDAICENLKNWRLSNKARRSQAKDSSISLLVFTVLVVAIPFV